MHRKTAAVGFSMAALYAAITPSYATQNRSTADILGAPEYVYWFMVDYTERTGNFTYTEFFLPDAYFPVLSVIVLCTLALSFIIKNPNSNE